MVSSALPMRVDPDQSILARGPIRFPRLAYGLAVLSSVVTWCLIVIGGLVHNTVSSLACPDWPLCYGELFPELEGGILYEHGHRYLGTLIGMSTIALATLLWRAHPPTPGVARVKKLALVWGALVGIGGGFLITPTGQAWLNGAGLQEVAHVFIAALYLALFASALALIFWRPSGAPNLACKAVGLLLLVIFQGLLGGATVAYKLPTIVSTGHLATSMLVLMTWIFIAHALRPGAARAQEGEWGAALRIHAPSLMPLLLVALVALYLQIVLGALVRHTGSHMAAGIGWNSAVLATDPATGLPALWPGSHPAQLNMVHRMAALLVTALLAIAIWRVWARLGEVLQGSASGMLLVWTPLLMVALQIMVGVTMIGLLLNIPMRTAHLAVGALVLVSYWLLVISIREGQTNRTRARQL